ncbi:NAD(P)H-dependent oxidoreductase [Stratiformator vulcanicus]|uniref:Flavodoxin-like fold domain-containing protein n=1 Tax=Stratiformator vulcanicus TaxID=2527980 RepID=A0A517R7P3_9PLAN|nr:NAD(P)H-dependent oxidoreductase [Stratiformator vulcanicus]QDT39908.1 hypothetical protein Pan189_43200 [Stratiformator vulcanicus]
MGRKVLVVLGHPRIDSYCGALATAYATGAAGAGHDVRRLDLAESEFDPVVRLTSAKDQPTEPEIIRSRELIEWCEHLVLVYPTWWGTTPALLKGWFDRVFVSDWAFRTREDSPLWDGLLGGRSARIITTMDAPPWAHRLLFGAPGVKAIKYATLRFCGIKPVKTKLIGSVKGSTPSRREKWLSSVERLGAVD